MLLNIRHVTAYAYDQPVELGPHCLRLTPRADSYASLESREFKITPAPLSLNHNVDTDGSICHWARFKESPVTALSIESKLSVRLHIDLNPFSYLIYPDACLNLPMVYPAEVLRELKSYLTTDTVSPKLRGFAFDVLSQAKGKTIDFLILLAQSMKRDFVYEMRLTGAPNKPEDTLRTRRGSCRDWAYLYMAAARAVGLAARFVSGYYYDENNKTAQLHAWVEIYIPGGGWRGFDPSLGLACYSNHLTLAACAWPSAATPVQGTFKGLAQAAMTMSLNYEIVD